MSNIRGSASALHAASAELVSPGPGPTTPPPRTIRVLEAAAPAIVLGSSQPDTIVDGPAARQLGVEVARRRSGGSAVLVGPGRALWVDVAVPVTDALWNPDVGEGARWLGDCWAEALRDLGVADARVWSDPMVRTGLSTLVCFAGVGPGEVTVGGQKVVGVSQRRTRLGVLFQCAVPLDRGAVVAGSGRTPALVPWDARPLLDVLAIDPERRREAASELSGTVLALMEDVAPTLVAALVARCRQAGTGELAGRQTADANAGSTTTNALARSPLGPRMP